jgi:serine/threonine protein kinase/tetratricopeptide (TPR) repeat protein
MPDLVRFGPFALNTETADLHGSSGSIRLPDQQFRILQMLIQRAGGVLSRDEIRCKLWPNGTIVEWERSINAAMLKLRSALRYTSSTEGHIETVPRRGYRLLIKKEQAGGTALSHAQTSLQQGRPEALLGQEVSHYRVVSILGDGGTSVVYRGEDLRLHRPVALKFLAEELARRPSILQRLEEEARTASSLNHPNICTVYDIGEHRGQPFIVMEFLEGETLESWIARFNSSGDPEKRKIALRQKVGLATQMADALSAAHKRGIIHRDIKPANVFVTVSGLIKLLDFGLAQVSDDSTPDGREISDQQSRRRSEGHPTSGTPAYMSPEQQAGDRLDQRSDIFSLGVLLAELFTGCHPSRGRYSEAGELYEFGNETEDLPQSLIVLIRRLLVRSRDLRYQSMSEVLADLKRIGKSLAEQLSAIPADMPLIGRVQEFETLKRLLSDAIAGHGSMVMIGGEPGIGKSYLARAVSREARRRGALTVIGHCHEMEGAPAYAPFIEMLEYIRRMAPREGLRYSLGENAPEVARLMPELRTIYPDIPPALQLPPEQQRRFLFNAFRSFVERAASVTPLVVVFEDLQWADDSTLLLLQHHAQTIASTPMLIICTFRDLDLEMPHPFARTLEALLRERQASRIVLRRFSMVEVNAFLAVLSDQAPPPALVRAVFEETDGNPFFVEEVFRHLAEEGTLFDETGKWHPDLRVSDLHVPESVRLVLGRRLTRLSEDSRRVLTTAAVIGRSFSLRLLEELENKIPDAALNAIEGAERAHLVTNEADERDPRFRFVHELVRQTLAESISYPRRQRLHLRIAEAIEKIHEGRLDSHASQLAHHLYQAGAAASPEKTIRYLLLAAQRARAGSAHEEALEHLDRAFSISEEFNNSRLAEVLYERAKTLRSLGRADEALAAYIRSIDLFERAGQYDQLAEASIALSYLQAWRVDAESAARTMEKAHDAVQASSPHLLRHVLSMRAAITSAAGDPATAESMLDRARSLPLSAATASAEPLPMLEAIHYYQSFQLEKVRSTCPRVAQACMQTGDPWNASSVEFYGIWAEMYCGSPEAGAAALAGAMSRAEKIGHYGAIWALKMAASFASATRGDLTRSQAETVDAWNFGEAHDVGWNFATSLQRGHFALWSGNLAEAESWYEHGLKLEGRSYLSGLAEASLFAAWAESGDGRAIDAWSNRHWPLPVPGELNSLGAWTALDRSVIGLARMGLQSEVAALRPMTEELLLTGAWTYALSSPFRTIAGVAAASAGDWAAAEEHHLCAVRQCDSAPYRHLNPVAREWYAQMLLERRARGDIEQASQLLQSAIVTYDALGFPARGRHARDTLASL